MKITSRHAVVLLLLTGIWWNACAQKQLVVLKNEKVLLRLYAGDEFVFRLKGSRKISRSYVNNLFDTAVLAHHAIIPFRNIDRVYFRRSNLMNVVGKVLVIGGVGYCLIDQINIVLVHGEDANISDKVVISSAAMVAVGLPMMLAKRNYARIGRKYRIIMVDKGSGFYRPDPRQEPDEY